MNYTDEIKQYVDLIVTELETKINNPLKDGDSQC